VTPGSRSLVLADSRGHGYRLAPVRSANGGQTVSAQVLASIHR
jgi:hypothetical protein